MHLGNVEHVIADNGNSTYKRYLANGSVLITQDHDRFDTRTAEDTRYLVKDHVGSLTGILDQYGAIDQSFSYDAWGQRRNPTDAAMLELLALRSTLHSRTTPRGYTGHEMLDTVGIIHMNGRIYDPRLGRFLQADPVIQFPHYSQNWNIYSYVLNNPLTYTDPTGYIIPIFTAIAVGIVAAGIVETTILAAVLIGAGVFADSLAQGVPLDKAFLAGVSAAALTAAGLGTFPETFGLNLATAGHVATVATVGGITTSLQGGKFGNGFLSAGLGSAAPALPGLRQVAASGMGGRALVSAVAAGTASEITGGKFANAAVSAAFLSLVSSAAEAAQASGSGKTPQGISNEVTTDARLGLTVEGDTLSGEILVGCSNVSASVCSQSIAEFQAINGTDGQYTVDLTIREAIGNENPSFELLSGGKYPRYKGFFRKSFRVFGRNYGRDIYLNRGNSGFSSTTSVHEFGHFLGLAHQANLTRSFMSYATNRYARPVSADFRRLVEGYR